MTGKLLFFTFHLRADVFRFNFACLAGAGQQCREGGPGVGAEESQGEGLGDAEEGGEEGQHALLYSFK